MREASDDRRGYRLRALIVVLWRGGLRVAEALALGERDLDPRRGSLLVRNSPCAALSAKVRNHSATWPSTRAASSGSAPIGSVSATARSASMGSAIWLNGFTQLPRCDRSCFGLEGLWSDGRLPDRPTRDSVRSGGVTPPHRARRGSRGSDRSETWLCEPLLATRGAATATAGQVAGA
jgi:hypothetical protein